MIVFCQLYRKKTVVKYIYASYFLISATTTDLSPFCSLTIKTDAQQPYIQLDNTCSGHNNNEKLINLKLEMKVTDWVTGEMEPFNVEHLKNTKYSCNTALTVSIYCTVYFYNAAYITTLC